MCFGFVSKHLGSQLGLFIRIQSHLPLNTITIMLWSYEVGCFFGWLSIFKQILATFGCILWYYTVFCYYICSPKGHWDVTFLALALWHCIDKNVINKTRLEVTRRWSQELSVLPAFTKVSLIWLSLWPQKLPRPFQGQSASPSARKN